MVLDGSRWRYCEETEFAGEDCLGEGRSTSAIALGVVSRLVSHDDPVKGVIAYYFLILAQIYFKRFSHAF
jgi:hypothetical protein